MFYFFLLLFVLGDLFLAFLLRGLEYKKRIIFFVILVEYIILIYSTTIFFRPIQESQEYNFRLFWSFAAFLEGKSAVIAEKILNIVVFVPVGLLLGIGYKRRMWYCVLLISSFLSVLIEILQFVLNRGFSEFDDVFYNTAGGMLGFGVYVALAAIGKVLCGWWAEVRMDANYHQHD